MRLLAPLSALFLIAAAPDPPPSPRPPPQSGSEEMVRGERGSNDDSLKRAASRPLRDLNLVKPKIEPELVAIMANPYDIRRLRSCRELNRESLRMTALVGPDVDDPALAGRNGRPIEAMLLDSAESITGSLVPGQGIIRQLSGANNAAREAAAARLAGQLRRAHIKGALKARGCPITPPPRIAPRKPR
jgi:hypothetical protein